MKEATADKKVLLYLTALGIVNTSISAIGLKESAKNLLSILSIQKILKKQFAK